MNDNVLKQWDGIEWELRKQSRTIGFILFASKICCQHICEWIFPKGKTTCFPAIRNNSLQCIIVEGDQEKGLDFHTLVFFLSLLLSFLYIVPFCWRVIQKKTKEMNELILEVLNIHQVRFLKSDLLGMWRQVMVNLMKNDKEACLLCWKIWDPV